MNRADEGAGLHRTENRRGLEDFDGDDERILERTQTALNVATLERPVSIFQLRGVIRLA